MAMTRINVTAAKKSGVKRSITVEYDFGKDLAEAMKKFDHAVIHNLFIDAAVIQRAGQIRPVLGIKKGQDGFKSDEVLIAEQKNWKPKMGRTSDPVKKKARIIGSFKTLSEDERAEIMKALTAAAGGTEPKMRLVKAANTKSPRKVA